MLIEALEYTNPNLQMPPGGKLPDEVTADFVQWVALGAPDPRDAQSVDTAKMDLESGRLHWAFPPPASCRSASGVGGKSGRVHVDGLAD